MILNKFLFFIELPYEFLGKINASFFVVLVTDTLCKKTIISLINVQTKKIFVYNFTHQMTTIEN